MNQIFYQEETMIEFMYKKTGMKEWTTVYFSSDKMFIDWLVMNQPEIHDFCIQRYGEQT